MTLLERFWSKVDRRGPDECWPWKGYVNKLGYADFALTHRRSVHAHRFSYELHKGPIPAGLQIDHTCHNGGGCKGGNSCLHRQCSNPSHLEAVTVGENLRRGEGFIGKNSRVTHCPKGHPYDEANTYLRKRGNGIRGCRACRNEARRAYDERTRSRRA